MENDTATMQVRFARIEAVEACRNAFNQYPNHLDGVLVDELLDVFEPDARLEVMNLPPGNGQDLTYSGGDDLRTLYAASSAVGDGRWRIASMRIASSWGRSIPQVNWPLLAEPLGAGTLSGGRPAGAGPGFGS